jgi:hypothetical protein
VTAVVSGGELPEHEESHAVCALKNPGLAIIGALLLADESAMLDLNMRGFALAGNPVGSGPAEDSS